MEERLQALKDKRVKKMEELQTCVLNIAPPCLYYS